MDNGACFSDDGKYRYKLWRQVPLTEGQADKGTVVFVMLNPSTANTEKNDPTIGRCMASAKRWGYGRLKVVNLFAYCSTNPERLADVGDPVGPNNDDAIRKAVKDANLVVCAWGQRASFAKGWQARIEQVLRMIERPHHLGLSEKDGQQYPRHPNSPQVPKGTKPQPWNPTL